MRNYFKKQKQKGFTLLFAVLVATLVISIGATIISISLRQTILSGTSRESQYAFYAANTALECARYWDAHGPLDENGNDILFPVYELGEIQTENTVDVKCSGEDITDDWILDLPNNKFTFYFQISNQSNPKVPSSENYIYCAEATITKELKTSTVLTTIESKGYNTCDTTNPRRVERGLILQYES